MRYLPFVLLLLIAIISGCSSNTNDAHEKVSSGISVGFRDVNGVRFIETNEVVEKVGTPIPSTDTNGIEFYQIPNEDPSKVIALKLDGQGYVKMVRKDIWCASADPSLQKVGQCPAK